MKTTDSIKEYGIPELHSIIPDDPHAVLSEALRRHALAAKKFIKAQKELLALETLVRAAQ